MWSLRYNILIGIIVRKKQVVVLFIGCVLMHNSLVGRMHRARHSTKILYPQIAGDNLVGVDTANICTRDRNKGWRGGGGRGRSVESLCRL